MELPIAIKQLLLMSGLPGSGKSTLAERIRALYLKHSLSCLLVSADEFFIGKDGQYRFIQNDLGKAHQSCWKRFYDGLSMFDLIIVDNTNLTAADLSPYILPAEVHKFSTRIIRVLCNPADAFARQRHNVPEGTYKRMVTSWEKKDVLPRWPVIELPWDADIQLKIQKVA